MDLFLSRCERKCTLICTDISIWIFIKRMIKPSIDSINLHILPITTTTQLMYADDHYMQIVFPSVGIRNWNHWKIGQQKLLTSLWFPSRVPFPLSLILLLAFIGGWSTNLECILIYYYLWVNSTEDNDNATKTPTAVAWRACPWLLQRRGERTHCSHDEGEGPVVT